MKLSSRVEECIKPKHLPEDKPSSSTGMVEQSPRVEE